MFSTLHLFPSTRRLNKNMKEENHKLTNSILYPRRLHINFGPTAILFHTPFCVAVWLLTVKMLPLLGKLGHGCACSTRLHHALPSALANPFLPAPAFTKRRGLICVYIYLCVSRAFFKNAAERGACLHSVRITVDCAQPRESRLRTARRSDIIILCPDRREHRSPTMRRNN
jgi:hypothetical protein